MKKLDRFLLREIISDGPAGTVYRAEEILPGDNRRVVALKVLPPVPGGVVAGESEIEKHFFGEVRTLAQLAVHPHVVTVYAMGISDGYPWLAMEYSGSTLAQKLGDSPTDPAEVLRMLEQVARGLAAMHALKPPLVHQDIKPANILLDQMGNYKVTDFSLATVTSANKTQGVATVRYAAPEMLSSEFGRVGPATDLYALGHVAYEMALGGKLHRAQFPAVFEGNARGEPAPTKWMSWHHSMSTRPAAAADVVRGFPTALSEVIARLLAKPLGERYASAEELLSDLAVLRHEIAGGGVPASASSATATASAAHAPRAAAPSAAASARAAAGPAAPPPLPAEPVTTGGAAKSPGGSSAGSVAGVVAASLGTRYWVRMRGKVSGPFDLPTLQRQLKQGQISRMHQVSTDQVVWKSAADVDGLYGPTVV